MKAWIAWRISNVHIKFHQTMRGRAKSLTETLPIFNQSNLRIPLKNHIWSHISYSPAIDYAEGLTTGLSPAMSDLDKGLSPSPGLCPPFRAAMVPPPGHGGFSIRIHSHSQQIKTQNTTRIWPVADAPTQDLLIVLLQNTGILTIMGFNRMDSAAYLANQMAKGFARSLQQRAAGLGFSPGQFPILLELWSEDGLTQKQLLERVDIEQATMAYTLSRMERDGLVERRPHPADKRAQLVFLTGKATAMQTEAVEAAMAADKELFRGFRTFERELLLEYVRRILENAKHL
jgi:DNA-binding MarR family transcriptional regulator